jgi:hypothetical protein
LEGAETDPIEPQFSAVGQPKGAATIVNDVNNALLSCSQICKSEIREGLPGRYPLQIVASLQKGPMEAHDVMQLVRRALNDIAFKLQTASLMSSRSQKEENGYSLRAAVACLPDGEEQNVCWDMFRKGHCRRRGQCRWYHPQDRDIVKIKVSVRYLEE